jgi:hypothetical protein
MSNSVTIKNGDFYYVIPLHEFSRYWLPELDKDLVFLELKKIPSDIPMVSKLAGLKRGKGVKRVVKAYDQKGGGVHGTNPY